MAPVYAEKIQGDQEAIEIIKVHPLNELKPATNAQTPSDLDLPQYSEVENSSFDPTEDAPFSAGSKFNIRQLPAGISPSALQASIEGALQVAAQTYFKSGAFARAMNDTIQRAATIQTSYRYKQESENSDSESKEENVTLPVESITNQDIIRSALNIRRPSQSRICY